MPGKKPSKKKVAATKKSPRQKRPKLPPWAIVYVWTRAGGRCEFPGCNESLWKDLYTTHRYNRGKLAHIVAASPDGPRGNRRDSPRLAKDPSNIMLLCGDHHDLVDSNSHEKKYRRKYLQKMKEEHETRIEWLTAIDPDLKSVPLTLQIPISNRASPMPKMDVRHAIACAGRYPDVDRWCDIDLLGMSSRDHDSAFWDEARRRIAGTLESRLAFLRSLGSIPRLAIFPVGPMPLLIDFGRKLGDIAEADVFNLHRRPKGWVWPEDRSLGEVQVVIPASTPPSKTKDVALVISITSEVQEDHYRRHLDAGTPIFELRVANPVPDSLRCKADLENFGSATLRVMEAIHRADASRIHVFPAMPVAAAVEFGRCLLPKLHAPLVIYDLNRATGGLTEAFVISEDLGVS